MNLWFRDMVSPSAQLGTVYNFHEIRELLSFEALYRQQEEGFMSTDTSSNWASVLRTQNSAYYV